MTEIVEIYRQGWAPILAVTALMLVGFGINRRFGSADRTFRETALNIFIFLTGYGMQILFINELQNRVLGEVGGLWPWQLPINGATFLVAYVAVDFFYYWRHRLEHGWGLLWAEHCVHHNSRELNLSTAGRLPWIMIATLWIAYIPLVLMGFSAEQLVLCWSLNMAFQFLAHVDVPLRTPWLDLIFSTPSNHRVHHGENAIYLHRNFGATFIIWDRIFGTYQAETEPVRIGCGMPPAGVNPVRVNFEPMVNYLRTRFTGGGSLPRSASESVVPTSLLGK